MESIKTPCGDLAGICLRVGQKRQDYIRYDFSRKKNDILKTFFDLSQEFDDLHDFYRICVAVPLESFALDSRLYLVDEASGTLELVCDSQNGVYLAPPGLPRYIRLQGDSYEECGSFIVPILRKWNDPVEPGTGIGGRPVLGMLELFPVEKLTEEDKFFFSKYTNRIAYNLKKRMLAEQNITHLKFINNLVMDIEHNVIVPNMYFRHLFNQLKKRIKDMEELEELIEEMQKGGLPGSDHTGCALIIEKVKTIHRDLIDSYHEMSKHHSNYSLFLESLFRRDHFEQGHLVLRPKSCMVDEEIIAPQLEHYDKRLLNQGITIERPEDMQGEEHPLMVDRGLLAQVYANLFSNAVKYTEEITTRGGRKRKALTYGRTVIKNYFGPGIDGIKLNVFTTGPHLLPEEAANIYLDGFKGKNSQNIGGSGHGLSFVKQVVEIHGGQVGYEPTEQGNNFYFILPLLPKG